MSDEIVSPYTQGLMDTIMALSKEVGNLRTGYEIIHQRIEAISSLADKTTADAVKEAILAEELVKLSLVAANIANKTALINGNKELIDATQACILTAENAYNLAVASTVTNESRQTRGGLRAKA